MSKLIRDRAIVEDDWLALADDGAPPPQAKLIVSLARWQQERDALQAQAAAVGVRLPNIADLAPVWPAIADRPLIALEFPKSGDGRAYSQARLLRERYHFAGEIRAVGDVIRDHFFFMQRCGFNAFEPRADQDFEDCLRALNDFSLAYQHAADPIIPAFARRRWAG